MQISKAYTGTQESTLSTHRVLRNTYALLAATLLFSGVMAAISMAVEPPRMISMVMTLGAIGVLMFLLPKFENSSAGVGICLLYTSPSPRD